MEDNQIPTFIPPDNNGINQNSAPSTDNPTFAPPEGTDSGAPVFTPPAQTFTPPTNPIVDFSGPACAYHADQPAKYTCCKCGKKVCKDCHDSFGFEGDNKTYCYDCTMAIANETLENHHADRIQVIIHFALMAVGMIAGAIFGGVNAGGAGVAIGLLVGGSLITAAKVLLPYLWMGVKEGFVGLFQAIFGGGFSGILSALISLIVGIAKAIFYGAVDTIKKTVKYISYIIKVSSIINKYETALQSLRDYMEYTLVRSQNAAKTISLDDLVSQHSELADNSFVINMRTQGEAQAMQMINEASDIAEDCGRIIRAAHAEIDDGRINRQAA